MSSTTRSKKFYRVTADLMDGSAILCPVCREVAVWAMGWLRRESVPACYWCEKKLKEPQLELL